MKKVLTLSLLTGLLVSLSFSQFTTGTKSVSSVFSYSSVKYHEDQDDNLTTLTINPTGSYFVMDNISVDVGFELVTMAMGDEDQKSTNIVLGGAYYYPLESNSAVYGGGGLKINSSAEGDGDAVKQNFLNIKGGYLHGLSDNWYFDIGLKYDMQMGATKVGSEDGSEGASKMWLGVGIVTFFN